MSTLSAQQQSNFTKRSFSVVHHNAINFSTAQQKFSFGIGKRFSVQRPNTNTDFT